MNDDDLLGSLHPDGPYTIVPNQTWPVEVREQFRRDLGAFLAQWTPTPENQALIDAAHDAEAARFAADGQ